MNNVCILVSGAPGTGKTTVQRLAPTFFAERLGETAAFGTDEVYQLIDPDWSRNSERLGLLCRRNCIALALNVFRHDFHVVLIAGNALYDKVDVDDYFAALGPVSSVYHFTLVAPADVLNGRVQARGDREQHPREWLAAWLALVQRHAGSWTHIIDTAQCSPLQTLENMMTIIQAESMLG